MTIKLLIPIFIFSLFFNSETKAQEERMTEIDSIQFRIFDIFQKNEKPSYDSIEAEIIIVILQTDSNSMVSDIHLLADGNNRGIAYDMLCKMTPAYFKEWSPKHRANMTIIIPVYSTGVNPKNKRNYADKSFWEMPWAGGTGCIIREDKNSILLSGIMYQPSPPAVGCGIVMPSIINKQ